MLTEGEERGLVQAENIRLRKALDIAQRGLAAARDAGFAPASAVIAEMNAALTPVVPVSEPLRLPAWLRWLLGRQ